MVKIPIYNSTVSAGFPSPADDFIENSIDLNNFLIKNNFSTFLVRVKGDSMIDAAIKTGDILVVDRSLNVSEGKIIIALVDGEFLVKKYHFNKKTQKTFLLSENSNYKPIEIKDNSDNIIWGIVTSVIRKL